MGIRERVKEAISGELAGILDRVLALIESEAVAREKALIKRCKKLWYYAGKWHNAECDFILHDQGVCNCPRIRLQSTVEAEGEK